MKIDLNKIKKCVINIPERTDRLISIKREIDSFYTNKEFQLIKAIKGHPSHKFCAQSHQEAIKLNYNEENLTIMEDDCIFTDIRACAYAQECFNNIPEDADILLGGIYEGDIVQMYNENWNLLKGQFSCMHFYIIRKQAYDKFLAFDGHMHIDLWAGRNFKCYVAQRMFAIQSAGISDNRDSYQDYSELLKNFILYKK